MNKNKTRICLCCRLSAIVLLTLWCVTSTAAPPTPGAVRGSLPKQERLQLPTDTAPPEIETPEPKRTAPTGSTKTIRVQQFDIYGNSAISTTDLITEIQPFIGQDLTLDDLYTVADVLTDYYRASGYSLAQVVVPAQRVQKGIVRLDVIEGKINEVRFEGNRSYTNRFLEPFFAKVQPGAVVSMQSLERELLVMNDLPGLTSRAVVQPGPTYGTTDLVLRSQEDRFEGRVSGNNYGRQDIGEWRVEVETIFNNPLRRGDRFTFLGLHSEADLLNYLNADYSIALNGKGTRAGLNVSWFDYDVGEEFADLDIDGNNLYAHLLFSHPFQRSRKRNVLAGLGFTYNHSKERVLGVTTKDDDLYYIDLTVLANWLHKRSAYSSARVTIASNFQDNADGSDNEKLEAKLEVELDHLRAIAKDWLLYARIVGVYSADPLPDIEKLDLGGIANIRGFPSSEVRGDKGGFLTLEIRRQFRFKNGISGNIQAFWDAGEANKIDAPPGIDSYDSLTSVGLGLTLSYKDQYVLEVAGAVPTSNRDVSDSRDDGRGWVNISAYF